MLQKITWNNLKKKSRKITDDMKSKLERTEIEQEMNIKKFQKKEIN